MRRIKDVSPAPGGYEVTIEVTGAYKDGSSRLDRVFVSAAEAEGRTREEALLAIKGHVRNDMESLRGADLDAEVTETKAVLEARLRQQVYDVANLVIVRNEAEALGRPQTELDAWAQLRNDLYMASLETLDAWSNA